MGKRSRKTRATSGDRPRTSQAAGATSGDRPRASRAADAPPEPPKRLAGIGAAVLKAQGYGEDDKVKLPEPIWGKVPVTEIAILAGLVAIVIGFIKGLPNGALMIGVGVGLCAITSVESSWREHRSGYKQHSFFLALIITLILHAIVGVIIGGRRATNPLFFGVDFVVMLGFAYVLAQRFTLARARAERVAAAGR